MSTCTCKIIHESATEKLTQIDPFCGIHGTGAQPLPVATEHPIAHEMVAADLQKRLLFGIAKYGVPLQPHNGRDSLLDAYEEVLDAAVYLRNALYERDGK